MRHATLTAFVAFTSCIVIHSFILKTKIKKASFSYLGDSPEQISNAPVVPNVHTFVPTPFMPRWGIVTANEHYQTIIGSGALQSILFGKPERPFSCTTERINTPDGDFFDIEFTDGFESRDSIVLITHGLESSTKGNLVTNFATAFLDKGMGCCLVGFRGCNGEENMRPGAYHLGFTDDLNQLTALIHERFPNMSIYLSGFSLGGNVALKLLGELGESAKERNIKGAAVTCVPFDPVQSQVKLDVGFNRAVYSENFLSTLKGKAERENAQFPGLIDIEAIRVCKTIGEFDDLYIAKIYNFKDKVDYYRKTGSKWWLKDIRVPVIAINARDDPFIEESSLPTPDDVGQHAPVKLVYTKNGGHCGYMHSSLPTPEHGFLGEELSRALCHIRLC